MTIYIALLRGINVGGHNVIKMAEFKNLFESMGFGSVKTYIQSGNVLFESDEKVDLLRQRIEQEVYKGFGFSVTVILRTAKELEQIIKNCPFKAETLSQGESLHIAFLTQAPSQEAINHVLTYKSETEECKFNGKEIYLLFRQSIYKRIKLHFKKGEIYLWNESG